MLTQDVWDYVLETMSPIEAFFAFLKIRTTNAWMHDLATRNNRWSRLIQRLTPNWLTQYKPMAAWTLQHLICHGRFLVSARKAIPHTNVVSDFQSSTPPKHVGAFRLVGPLNANSGNNIYLIRMWMCSHVDNTLYLNNRLFKVEYNDNVGDAFRIRLLLPPKKRLGMVRFATHGMIGVYRLHETITPALWECEHSRFGSVYKDMVTFMETLRTGAETFHYDWCDTRAAVVDSNNVWQTKVLAEA